MLAGFVRPEVFPEVILQIGSNLESGAWRLIGAEVFETEAAVLSGQLDEVLQFGQEC